MSSFSRTDFDRFVRRLDLCHFTADELLCSVGRRSHNGILNRFPPRGLWSGLAPTALALDALREELGAPIEILSAYRSPSYNRSVGGGASSQHLAFRAIDFRVLGDSADDPAAGGPAEWARRLKSWRGRRRFASPVRLDIHRGRAPLDRSGLELELTETGSTFTFQGGIGVYPKSHFVHVDCRGRAADWWE